MDTTTKRHQRQAALMSDTCLNLCFKLGHMSYLFNLWTKEEVQELTTMQVIEKYMRLFGIKEHYQHQNLDLQKNFQQIYGF